MKKIIVLLLISMMFYPIKSFSCFMDDVQQKVFEDTLTLSGLPAQIIQYLVIQVNNIRVALVVNGMTDEEIKKLTDYIANLKDPTVILNNSRFLDGIVNAQSFATQVGMGGLVVLGCSNKGTGVQTILQGRVGTAVQTIKLNTGTQQPEYSTTAAIITNNQVQTVSNQVNKIHNIDTTPTLQTTPQVDATTSKTVILPRKKRISTNGAGGVIITNSLIKNK